MNGIRARHEQFAAGRWPRGRLICCRDQGHLDQIRNLFDRSVTYYCHGAGGYSGVPPRAERWPARGVHASRVATNPDRPAQIRACFTIVYVPNGKGFRARSPSAFLIGSQRRSLAGLNAALRRHELARAEMDATEERKPRVADSSLERALLDGSSPRAPCRRRTDALPTDETYFTCGAVSADEEGTSAGGWTRLASRSWRCGRTAPSHGRSDDDHAPVWTFA